MVQLKPDYYLASELKAEREREKIQAMRDYQAEKLAHHANMMRLRALRLAKESSEAQATTAPRLATKKLGDSDRAASYGNHLEPRT